jgi:long-chain fatty acid transport protein
MYNATEDLRFGINYRSEIMVEAEGGDATFQNVPNSPLTPFQDTQFDAALPMPAELSVGLSYELLDKWLFAFDYNMTYWDVYESLDIDFANATPDSNNPRNYKNSSSYRFGLQYFANETVTLRVGYYFDESPVQSGYFAPETPRNDAHGFTGGLSLHVSDRFSIDAAFLYNRYEEVDESYNYYTENGETVPFEGTYKTSAFIPGLGVTYKL